MGKSRFQSLGVKGVLEGPCEEGLFELTLRWWGGADWARCQGKQFSAGRVDRLLAAGACLRWCGV